MLQDYSLGQGLQTHKSASTEHAQNFNNHESLKELRFSCCSWKMLLLSLMGPHSTWSQGLELRRFCNLCALSNVWVCNPWALWNLKIIRSKFMVLILVVLFVPTSLLRVASGSGSYVLMLWETGHIFRNNNNNREDFNTLRWTQLCRDDVQQFTFLTPIFLKLVFHFHLFAYLQNVWTIFMRKKPQWGIDSIKKVGQKLNGENILLIGYQWGIY